jgi:5-(carboxyamino)imidazole ribonucleotide mutase
MSSEAQSRPRVGILMGSDSDLPVMQAAADACKSFGIGYELRVLSAHRTPHDVASFAESAVERGLRVIIAGAGGAAHLAGVVAAHTPLPVIGVPVSSGSLNGLDALLATAQMPRGVPVATVAIGGAANAGLLAVQILATGDAALLEQVQAYKARLAAEVREKDARVQQQG